jgi:short-subunit dehydrogenase
LSKINTGALRPLEVTPTAIIVGASSGVGAALATVLVQHGYQVALVSRRKERLSDLCTTLNQKRAQAFAYEHDVRDTAAVPALFQQITNRLGNLDLFVYNAGVMFPANPEVYDIEQDLQTMQVNILGAMAWLNPVAHRFERARTGQIVGIGSVAGDRGRRGSPAYNTSKAALHTYLESLRNRLSRFNVTVTTIKLGQVQTDMLKNADQIRGPITAQAAAQGIYRAIRMRQQEVYIPFKWALVSWVIRNIPSVIFRRLNL